MKKTWKRLCTGFLALATIVADPWYTRDFKATWQDVTEGCQGLLNALTKK